MGFQSCTEIINVLHTLLYLQFGKSARSLFHFNNKIPFSKIPVSVTNAAFKCSLQYHGASLRDQLGRSPQELVCKLSNRKLNVDSSTPEQQTVPIRFICLLVLLFVFNIRTQDYLESSVDPEWIILVK